MIDRLGLRLSLRLVLGSLLLLAASAAFSQPFDAWLTNSAGHSYVQLPASSALTFAGGSFTFEAWVSIQEANGTSGCSSIAGNGYTAQGWIGICGTTLRSYMQGSGSSLDGGTVPANNWTHIAVTFDNAIKMHRHYIDGELVAARIETDPITTTPNPWRIFSDVSWQHTPNGAIDEVRFWNVARTPAQIRSTINEQIDSPQPGLVAVYEFDGDANDAIGTAHGTKVGTTANYLNAAITSGCTTSAAMICLGPGGRFQVLASYKVGANGPVGQASVVPFVTSESGLFTFFSPTNWETVVKVVNGCGVNGHYWVFAGGLTDQHVELEVSDLQHGVTKRYFNYAGTPFQPVTDVSALATCP